MADSLLRERIERLAADLVQQAMRQPITENRDSYSDGYAAGLIEAISRIRQITDAAPSPAAEPLVELPPCPKAHELVEESLRVLQFCATVAESKAESDASKLGRINTQAQHQADRNRRYLAATTRTPAGEKCGNYNTPHTCQLPKGHDGQHCVPHAHGGVYWSDPLTPPPPAAMPIPKAYHDAIVALLKLSGEILPVYRTREYEEMKQHIAAIQRAG